MKIIKRFNENNKKNLNESSIQKDSLVLPDKSIICWGWEKGYNNGGCFYVEKAYKVSDTDELYQTEFHRTYATEEEARRAYNRYRLKNSGTNESFDDDANELQLHQETELNIDDYVELPEEEYIIE